MFEFMYRPEYLQLNTKVLFTEGKTKAIGVSNFGVSDLKALKSSARVWPPALNQCSLSVGYHDDQTMAYCDAHKIVYMAYSPLCGGSNGSSCKHGSVMSLPPVQTIAQTHNVSAAQIALKFLVQQVPMHAPCPRKSVQCLRVRVACAHEHDHPCVALELR